MNSDANAICGRLGELNVKKMGKTSLMRYNLFVLTDNSIE